MRLDGALTECAFGRLPSGCEGVRSLRAPDARDLHLERAVTDQCNGSGLRLKTSRMGPGANRSYNEPLALRMGGALDVQALEAALQTAQAGLRAELARCVAESAAWLPARQRGKGATGEVFSD